MRMTWLLEVSESKNVHRMWWDVYNFETNDLQKEQSAVIVLWFSHETNCWRNPCLLKSDPRNSCVRENFKDLAVSSFHKSENSTGRLSIILYPGLFFCQRHWSPGRAQSWFRWSYPPGVMVIKPSSLAGGFTPFRAQVFRSPEKYSGVKSFEA